MIRFSEWRFIQYIATFGACQIVTILTVVIITFGYPQKLTMYTIPEDYVSYSDYSVDSYLWYEPTQDIAQRHVKNAL